MSQDCNTCASIYHDKPKIVQNFKFFHSKVLKTNSVNYLLRSVLFTFALTRVYYVHPPMFVICLS